jgi:hypothetical protein
MEMNKGKLEISVSKKNLISLHHSTLRRFYLTKYLTIKIKVTMVCLIYVTIKT